MPTRQYHRMQSLHSILSYCACFLSLLLLLQPSLRKTPQHHRPHPLALTRICHAQGCRRRSWTALMRAMSRPRRRRPDSPSCERAKKKRGGKRQVSRSIRKFVFIIFQDTSCMGVSIATFSYVPSWCAAPSSGLKKPQQSIAKVQEMSVLRL